MSDSLRALIFVLGAGVSLSASWLLVSRLERIGARLGFSEGLLGLVAALAADAPEITAAVTALAGHNGRIGAGVAIGSNVFNLASLLGLAALASGYIALHRRVILLEGVIALWIGAVCVTVVVGALPDAAGLALVLAVLVPYAVLLAVPRAGGRWLAAAVSEEEQELEAAVHPGPGRRADWLIAGGAVLVVIGASVAMEQAASALGSHHGVPQIVVGGLVLAGVTSLPNAVAGIYLARRGRGAATLSTAMNSNAINVAAGLLLPGAIVGLGHPNSGATLVAAWYLGLTAFALAFAYRQSGLRRGAGAAIVVAYLAFVAVLLAIT